jgi:ABC-2 type transport system permease protein
MSTAAPATPALRDVRTVLVRELRPTLRDPAAVVFSLAQPLVFLGLFGPLLAGLTGQPTEVALQSFVPGILVMTCFIGSSMTGANLLTEIATGSHERLLVTPLRRSSLMVGRALKEVVPVLAQSLLVVAVVLPFGVDLDPAGVALGLVLAAVFSVGVGGFSYALALAVRDAQYVFWLVQQTLLFPLLLLAGVLLPLETGPGWLRALSVLDPLRYLVDAERALFAGRLTDGDVLGGLAATVLTVAAGLAVGARAMRRA